MSSIHQAGGVTSATLRLDADAQREEAAVVGARDGQKVELQRNSEKLSSSESAEAGEEFEAEEEVENKAELEERDFMVVNELDPEKQRRFFLRRLPQLNRAEIRAKLQQFIRYFEGMSTASLNDIKNHAVQRLLGFGDVVIQYAALSIALSSVRNEKLRQAFQEILQEFDRKFGPAIRAALNITNLATEFAGAKDEDVQAARDTYRETVLEFGTVGQSYNAVVEKYGEQKFYEAIEFLIKAAGHDMGSRHPSLDPVRLQSVMDDLFQVQVLGNIHRNFSALIGKMQKQWKDLGLTGTGHHVMKEVLPLASAAVVHPEQVRSVAGTIGFKADRDLVRESGIYFLTQFKEQLRQLPLKIFEQPDKRENLLRAAQEALDFAVDNEVEDA